MSIFLLLPQVHYDEKMPEAILHELSERAVIRLSPEKPGFRKSDVQQDTRENREGRATLVDRLKSRVEEQSTLIAMLKQRGDTTLREVRTPKSSHFRTVPTV